MARVLGREGSKGFFFGTKEAKKLDPSPGGPADRRSDLEYAARLVGRALGHVLGHHVPTARAAGIKIRFLSFLFIKIQNRP